MYSNTNKKSKNLPKELDHPDVYLKLLINQQNPSLIYRITTTTMNFSIVSILLATMATTAPTTATSSKAYRIFNDPPRPKAKVGKANSFSLSSVDTEGSFDGGKASKTNLCLSTSSSSLYVTSSSKSSKITVLPLSSLSIAASKAVKESSKTDKESKAEKGVSDLSGHSGDVVIDDAPSSFSIAPKAVKDSKSKADKESKADKGAHDVSSGHSGDIIDDAPSFNSKSFKEGGGGESGDESGGNESSEDGSEGGGSGDESEGGGRAKSAKKSKKGADSGDGIDSKSSKVDDSKADSKASKVDNSSADSKATKVDGAGVDSNASRDEDDDMGADSKSGKQAKVPKAKAPKSIPQFSHVVFSLPTYSPTFEPSNEVSLLAVALECFFTLSKAMHLIFTTCILCYHSRPKLQAINLLSCHRMLLHRRRQRLPPASQVCLPPFLDSHRLTQVLCLRHQVSLPLILAQLHLNLLSRHPSQA